MKLSLKNVKDILYRKNTINLRDKNSISLNLNKYEKTNNKVEIEVILEPMSSYMIKNINNLIQCSITILDLKGNVLQNQHLLNNIFYTNNNSYYKFIISFIESSPTIKVEFLSKYNNLLISDEKRIIFILNMDEKFIKKFEINFPDNKYSEFYLIIFNYDINKIDNNKFLSNFKYYTIFSGDFLDKYADSLSTILNVRMKSYKFYHYNDDYFVKYINYITCFEKFRIREYLEKNIIQISIATYSKRKNMILDTLNSLTLQADIVNVFFNGYELNDVKNINNQIKNLNYIIDSAGDLRASGKFFWANSLGTHFICDDDIYYPFDYVEKGMNFLKQDIDGIFSCLGVIFPENVINFPKGQYRKKNIRFTEKCEKMIKVHLVGTGVCFFQGKRKFPSFETFLKHVTYNDDLLALYAKKNKINLYSIPKEDNWLISNEKMEIGLYEEKSFDPTTYLILSLFKENNPWII